jgi:triacylglycerol lipase
VAEKLELAIAVLNGAVGDYLARSKNPLATEMAFVERGRVLDRQAIVAMAAPSDRVVVLVHGLMCTETIWAMDDGADYGSLLARDLGFTPLYVRFNSGLAIPENGAALAGLVESLIDDYPVPIREIVFLGYSMGGLVVRSACHFASERGHRWLSRARRVVYLGTPHRGAPLERAGRTLSRVLGTIPDPTVKLLAELAELRSAGVKDLGDADLRHEDRARPRGPTLRDPRHPVPLLPSIEHRLVAATLSKNRFLAAMVGDAIVPVHSAIDPSIDPSYEGPEAGVAIDDVVILEGRTHLDLACEREVYEHIHRWCAA